MVSLIPDNLYPLVITVLLIILSAATSVIWYFLRDIKMQLNEKQHEQDDRIKQVEKDMADFKASLPHIYVLRDDFVRAIAGIDLKIDRMAREVSEVKGGVEKLYARLLTEGASRGRD